MEVGRNATAEEAFWVAEQARTSSWADTPDMLQHQGIPVPPLPSTYKHTYVANPHTHANRIVGQLRLRVAPKEVDTSSCRRLLSDGACCRLPLCAAEFQQTRAFTLESSEDYVVQYLGMISGIQRGTDELITLVDEQKVGNVPTSVPHL